MANEIYHASYEDEFEAEGFYSSDYELISWWSMNDAHWRGEYFDDMMRQLGIKIVYDDPTALELFAKEMEKVDGV